MCDTKYPSCTAIWGSRTRGSSPVAMLISVLSNTSCGVAAQLEQPGSMSRVHSASVCSDPKSPGGSRVRSAIAMWMGMRAPEMIEYISYA